MPEHTAHTAKKLDQLGSKSWGFDFTYEPVYRGDDWFRDLYRVEHEFMGDLEETRILRVSNKQLIFIIHTPGLYSQSYESSHQTITSALAVGNLALSRLISVNYGDTDEDNIDPNLLPF